MKLERYPGSLKHFLSLICLMQVNLPIRSISITLTLWLRGFEATWYTAGSL